MPRTVQSPTPYTVGVYEPGGEPVAYPTQIPERRTGAGLSRKTVREMIRRLTPDVVLPEIRAIFPVHDDATDANPPLLTYKILAGDDLGSITILGANLTGIVSVSVSTDVKVGGNSGTAPVVGTVIFTDTQISVPLDGTNSLAGDFWGVLLTDGDGNVYAAPSPLQVVVNPG